MDTKAILIGIVAGLVVGAGLVYGAISPQISSLQVQVNSLKVEADKILGLQSQISALATEKSSLQAQVNRLQSQIDTLTSEIQALKSYITVEKADLVLGAVEKLSPPDNYKITIYITNIGTRDIKISSIYLNGKTFWEANVSRVDFCIQNVTQTLPLTFLVPIGQKATMGVYLGTAYRSGQSIEIKILTATGNQITQTKILP